MDDRQVLADHERIKARAFRNIDGNSTVRYVPLEVFRNKAAAGEHFGLPLGEFKRLGFRLNDGKRVVDGFGKCRGVFGCHWFIGSWFTSRAASCAPFCGAWRLRRMWPAR